MRAAVGGPLRTGRLPALAVLIGCLVLLYGFFRAPDFAVERVVVQGLQLGRADEVALTAGVIEGPVFQVDADAIALRVATLPYVESVRVRAELPDRVVIQVVERVPVVVWMAGDQALLVDARGNVLQATDVPGLPRLQVDGNPPAVGGAVPLARIAASVAIWQALEGQLAALEWTQVDGLVARLADRRVIIFGSDERVPLKLAVLDAALQLPDRWTTLDIREPERPFYK